MDSRISDLIKPTKSSLHTAIFGRSGSGKTYFIKNSLYSAIKDLETFPKNHRFIIIDPKNQRGDYDALAEPIIFPDIEEILENINTKRTTVIWPDYDDIQYTIDSTIRILFEMADHQRTFSATLIIDEAGEVISHQKIPPMIGKIAVQGRAKNLKLIVLNQRPILNRKLDAQLEHMILFSMTDIDSDNLRKRWGISFESLDKNLDKTPYSFYHFNVMKNTKKLFGPLKVV